MLRAFEAWTVEPEEFVEHNDQLAVVVSTRTRPKGSSADIELRNGHLWVFRGGLVLSLRTFAQPEEALEAAGLSD
jgi:ketosteroid isomerase-like protein